MRRSTGWSRAALIAALFVVPTLAQAQYRPPPMTEAQRLASNGDAPRLEGSRLLASGDRKGAAAQFKKAFDYYEQALKVDPNLVTAAEGLGVVGNALGAHEKVIQYLQPAHTANPLAVDLAFNLGVAYFKTRRYQEAVPLLEKVRVAGQPEHLIAHYYLGQFHIATQRGDLAEQALQSYLKVRPEKVAGNDHEIYALLGKAYVQQRRATEARRAFELAQKGRPEDPSLQVGLANVLELEGKRSEAIAQLERISQRAPTHADAKERLIRLLLDDGNTQRAEIVAKDLLALGANATSHLLMADVLLAQKRYPEAEQQASKSLAAAPGYVLAQLRLGTALQAQGKHDPALKIFEEAVAGSGGSYEALAALGSANRRAGKFQKAIEVHRRALEQAPSFPNSHLLLGADYFAAGDWDRAIQHYETVLQLVPGDKKGGHWLALSYARRGRTRAADPNRLEDAVRDLRRAHDLEPSAALARALGAALLDFKAAEEAVSVLSASTEKPDATWQNAYLLGYAQLAAHQASEAVKTFTTAGELASDPSARAQVAAGRALAMAESGQLDAAVTQLVRSNAGEDVSENLPMLLYRRALARLDKGDVAGAREDVAAAERLSDDHPHHATLSALAKALVEVEDGNLAEASRRLRAARVERAPWLVPGAGPLLDAYLHYRADRFPQAIRAANPVARRDGAPGRFAQALIRSVHRKDAEKRYAKGDLRGAARAIKVALRAEPSSTVLAVNKACIDYAAGRSAGKRAARAVWARHEEAVAEAALNLGIDALAEGDVGRAVTQFDRYAQRGGSRAERAREWSERLRILYAPGAAVAQDGAGQ